jgi:hypothetical protein
MSKSIGNFSSLPAKQAPNISSYFSTQAAEFGQTLKTDLINQMTAPVQIASDIFHNGSNAHIFKDLGILASSLRHAETRGALKSALYKQVTDHPGASLATLTSFALPGLVVGGIAALLLKNLGRAGEAGETANLLTRATRFKSAFGAVKTRAASEIGETLTAVGNGLRNRGRDIISFYNDSKAVLQRTGAGLLNPGEWALAEGVDEMSAASRTIKTAAIANGNSRNLAQRLLNKFRIISPEPLPSAGSAAEHELIKLTLFDPTIRGPSLTEARTMAGEAVALAHTNIGKDIPLEIRDQYLRIKQLGQEISREGSQASFRIEACLGGMRDAFRRILSYQYGREVSSLANYSDRVATVAEAMGIETEKAKVLGLLPYPAGRAYRLFHVPSGLKSKESILQTFDDIRQTLPVSKFRNASVNTNELGALDEALQQTSSEIESLIQGASMPDDVRGLLRSASHLFQEGQKKLIGNASGVEACLNDGLAKLDQAGVVRISHFLTAETPLTDLMNLNVNPIEYQALLIIRVRQILSDNADLVARSRNLGELATRINEYSHSLRIRAEVSKISFVQGIGTDGQIFKAAGAYMPRHSLPGATNPYIQDHIREISKSIEKIKTIGSEDVIGGHTVRI